MSFKIPFSLSSEEKALMDLYTILNGQLNNPTSSWRLIKEEVLTPKSARVNGYISIIENGIERRSDSFTAICEDARPKEVITAIANIKLLVMCCTALGIPVDFQFEKNKKPTEYHEVKSWNEVAEDHALDPIMVAKCSTIKSLRRYSKSLNFPIGQALEEVQKKFESERVTTKQFFEFLYGESNYNKVKSSFKKRKAERISSPQKEDDSKQEAPVEKVQAIEFVAPSTARSHSDAKYVIGKMISHGINSSTFAKISQSMADKYGNFQYFCINASEDEVASVLMLVS
jgi:hypothetical protein